MDKEQRQLLKGLRVQVKELADILKLVAASQDVDAVRKEHMQFLGTVGSRTLTPHELKLAKEGISLDELRKICRKILASEQSSSVRDTLAHGHLLRMVYAEHDMILYYLSDLEAIAGKIQALTELDGSKRLIESLLRLVKRLSDMEIHHVREERIIFPQLAAHGYGDVPQSVFSEHVGLRKARAELRVVAELAEKDDFGQWKSRLAKAISEFVPLLREHIYKEENLIYPNALKVIQDPRKWNEMKTACDDIGISSN